MILDSNLAFASTATSVGTPNNTTVNVGDIIDLGGTPNNLAAGEAMALVVNIIAAVTSGGAATVRFKVVSDATTTIAVDGTATEHGSTDDLAIAGMTAGTQYVIPLVNGSTFERYLAFQVTETASQALTGGTVQAHLVPLSHVQSTRSYADAAN